TYTSQTASVDLATSPVVDLYINPDSYKELIEVKNNLTRTVTLGVCPGGKVKVTPFSTDNISGYKFQWYDATNSVTSDPVTVTSKGNAGESTGVYTSGEVELAKGTHTLTVTAAGGCKTVWTVYVQEAAGIITLGDIAKVCPGDPLTVSVEGAKSVSSVKFVVEETLGATPTKIVADFGWSSSKKELTVNKLVDVSLYKDAYQYYYEVEFTNEDNCTETKTFIPKNLAAPQVEYVVKNGNNVIGKVSSIDPEDNVTLWTTERVCPGTVLTITLNNLSADMTNAYVVKDAEGNKYGSQESVRYSKSDPFSFTYTVPALAAGGEVIRFTVKTDGMNGNVAQCSITEKLAIQVKPTVQIDMAASATQITDVTAATLASNAKNTYCEGDPFYFYVRPFNEAGDLASATVTVQNSSLLSAPSTTKETFFNGNLKYGMSGKASDNLGQFQTLKVTVTDDGCTATADYNVYVKPLPKVTASDVHACPNSSFEISLGDKGTANAIVNEDNSVDKINYAFYTKTSATDSTASQQVYDETSLTKEFTAPTPATGASYNVSGVVTAKNGCTTKFYAPVSLYPTPSFDAKVVDLDGVEITGVVCQGASYAIQLINQSATGVTFKVKDNLDKQIGDDYPAAVDAQRQTAPFIAPNEKTTKEYLISCVTSNGCEATDKPLSVEIGVKPTLDFNPVTAVCSDPNGDPTAVTVTAVIGATNTAKAGTIDFTNGVTGTFSENTLQISNPLLNLQNGDVTRDYSATYTDGNGCKSDPKIVTLSQVPTPIISAVAEKAKVCPNDNNTVLLDDASGDFSNGYSYTLYEWNGSSITGSPLGSWINKTVTSGSRVYGVIDLPKQSTPGTYKYAVVAENTVNGKKCSYTKDFEYTVSKLPTIGLVVYKNSVDAANKISDGDAVCPETPLIFQVKNTSYNVMSTDWNLTSDKQNGSAPGTSLNDATTNINWYAMDKAGTETITIVAENDGCEAIEKFQFGVSSPASLRITSNEKKLPNDGVTLFCEGDTKKKTLTASGTGSTFSNFVWTKEGDDTQLSTTNTLDVYAGDDITYIVTAKDAAGCEASAKEVVKLAALPAITLSADPRTVCAGEPITLTSQKTPASHNVYGDSYTYKITSDLDGNATTSDGKSFDLTVSAASDKATLNISSSSLNSSDPSDATSPTKIIYAYPQVTIDNGDVCVGEMASTTIKVIPSPVIVSAVKVAGKTVTQSTNTGNPYMLCSTDEYTVEVNVNSSMFTGSNPSYTSATKFEISVDGQTQEVTGQNIAKFNMPATTGALTHAIAITPIIDGNKRGACMADGTISVDVYANPTIKLYASSAKQTTNADASPTDGTAGAYLCSSAGVANGTVWVNSYMTFDATTDMKSIEWAADNYSVPATNTQKQVEIGRSVKNIKARITDNNGCVSAWSSPLNIELCEVATPRVEVPKGCAGDAVVVTLGDANDDVTTNSALMNSKYTYYELSYDTKTVERYLPDDITGTDAKGRPYYSVPVANVASGTIFTATAYNACGNAANYLEAECKSTPNTATAEYKVSVAPKLKVTFAELSSDVETDKFCPKTPFQVLVEVENFTSTSNLTDAEKVLDLELTYTENGQVKTQRGSITFDEALTGSNKTFFEIRGGMDYVAGANTITFNVTAKNYDGCEASKSANVTIQPRPVVNLVATKYTRIDGNDVYYCPGVPCEIKAQSTTELKENSYVWYYAPNGVPDKDGTTFGKNPTLIPTELTNYLDADGSSSYYVTAVSASTGCTSLPSNTLFLKKIPVPHYTAYADPNTVCTGDQTSIKIGTLSDPISYNYNIINKYGTAAQKVGAMFSTTTGEPIYKVANYASNAPYGVRLTTPDGCINDIAVSVTPTDGPIIDWEVYNASKSKVVAAYIHEMTTDANGIAVPKKNADGSYVVRTDAEYAFANANHRNQAQYVYDEVSDPNKEHPGFGYFCVGDVYYLYLRNVRSSQPNEPAIYADTFSVNDKGVKKHNGKLFNTSLANRWVALEHAHGPSKSTHFPAVTVDGIHIQVTDSCFYADGTTVCPAIINIDLDVKQTNPTVNVIGVPNYICRGEEFSFKIVGRANDGAYLTDAKVWTTGNAYQKLDYVSGPDGSADKFKKNVSDNSNWEITTDGNYVWNARRVNGETVVNGDAGLKFPPEANTAYYARVWDNYGCASNQWGRTVTVYDVPTIKLDYADPACENSQIKVLVNPNNHSKYYFREYTLKNGNVVDMDGNIINEKSQVIDENGELIYALDADGNKILDEDTEDPNDYKLKSPHPFTEGFGTGNIGSNIYGAINKDYYNFRYFNSSKLWKSGDPIIYQVYATIERTNNDDGSTISCPSKMEQIEFTPDQNPKIKAAFYDEDGNIKTTFCPGEKVTVKVGIANGAYFLDKSETKNETYKSHSVTYYSNYAKIPAINFNNIVHNTTVPSNATMNPFAGETEKYYLLDDQFSFIAPETAGTYTIKVTDKVTQSYSCPKDTNIVFTIAERPKVTLAAIKGNVDPKDANHVYVCEGDFAELQANSTTSNCTYKWYSTITSAPYYPTTESDPSKSIDRVSGLTPNQSASRFVKIVDGQGCESDFSNEIRVDIAPNPTISVDQEAEYVCPNTSAIATINASGAKTWQFFTTDASHTEYNRLDGEVTKAEMTYSKMIKEDEFVVNPEGETKPHIYKTYVGVENREAGSISYGCRNYKDFTFKEAKTPVVQLKVLKVLSDGSTKEISTPCYGDEYYVQVVDATTDRNPEATLSATLVLKGTNGAADKVIELNSSLISKETFIADVRKRFSVTGYNKYDDGTSCPSEEVPLVVNVNKLPVISLNATEACEKNINKHDSEDSKNGSTTFSTSVVSLDKANNSSNSIKSYTWDINGNPQTSTTSTCAFSFESVTDAIATVTAVDANGCESEPVTKTVTLKKRPHQILTAEAKCVGDNQIKIVNTMDPDCGFSANEATYWYRVYKANLTQNSNGAYTDTVAYLRKSFLAWLEAGKNETSNPHTPSIYESPRWREGYSEAVIQTPISDPMWVCTRLKSIKAGNTCESEVECVLVNPSQKPTFDVVLENASGEDLQPVNKIAEVCPATSCVVSVNVGAFPSGCAESSITVREAGTNGRIIGSKTITSQGINKFNLGAVSSNMDLIIDVESSCGCLSSDRYQIKVLPIPTVSLVSEGSRIENGVIYVCPEGTANLKAVPSSVSEIANYVWYENESENTTHNDAILSNQSAGSYQVKVIDDNGCESQKSNTIVIEEVQVPTVSASAPEVVCDKTAFNITIDNPQNGITYVVYNPADNGSSAQTSARATIKKTEEVPSISVTIPSTYTFKGAEDNFTVVAKNDRGCVSDPYVVTVEKADKPNVTILAKKYGSTQAETADLSVCPNDMVEFSLTNTALLHKNFTYTVTPSNLDVILYGTTTNSPTAQMLDKKTIFTFSFESEAGCVSEGVYTVKVNNPGTLRIADNVVNRYDNKPIVCPGGETPVTLTASKGVYVNWEKAGLTPTGTAVTNEGHDANVAATITFYPSVEQSYNFTGTDESGCEVSATYDILIANKPEVENIAVTLGGTPVKDLAVCEGSIITLSASGSIANAKDGESINNYEWYTDVDLTAANLAGNGAKISQTMSIADNTRNAEGFYIDIQDEKSYWVRATSNFGCKSGTMKTTVTVDRTPEIKFKNASDPCIGTDIEITPNTGSSNQYFTITNLTTDEVYEDVLLVPFTPEKAGQSYNFKVEAVRGACKATEYTSINAKAQPVIKLYDAETGLAYMNACPDVDGSTSEHYIKFTVDASATTGKNASVTPDVVGATLYNESETDAYYAKYNRPTALESSIKVTAKGSNGCEATAEFPITIKPTPNKPAITVLRNGEPSSDNSFCEGDKVTVIAQSTNDNDKSVSFVNGGKYGEKIDAKFDASTGTAMFEFDAISSTENPDQEIKISATNDDNCNSAKASVSITVSDKLDLKINNNPSNSTIRACVGSVETLRVTASTSEDDDDAGTPVDPEKNFIEWFASDKSTSLSKEATYDVMPDPVYTKTIWVHVKSKDALGCEAWSNITIAPVAVPSITIVAENTNTGKRVSSTSPESDSIVYCNGDAGGLNISAIVPSDVTYKWDGGEDNVDLTEKGGYNTTQTNKLTVTYKTASGMTCTTTREFKTVVKNKPTITIPTSGFFTSVAEDGSVVTDPSKCVGDKVTLNPKFTDDVVSYLWHNGATSPTLEVNIASSARYDYKITATTADGCSVEHSDYFTPSYVPSFSLPTVYACVGEPATIKPNGPAGQIKYTYYDEAGTTWIGDGDATDGSFTIPQLNQTMRYSVVASANGCSTPTPKRVGAYILSYPALQVNENVSVCAGSNAVLSVQNPVAGTDYYWNSVGSTDTETSFSVSVGNETKTVKVFAVKDYSLTYDAAPKCTTSKVITIEPKTVPDFAITASAERLCPDGRMTFTINDATATNTYVWKAYEYDSINHKRADKAIDGFTNTLAADKAYNTNGLNSSTGYVEIVAEGASENGCAVTTSIKLAQATQQTLALVAVDKVGYSAGAINLCSNTDAELEFTSGYNSYEFNGIPMSSNTYVYNEVVNQNKSFKYNVTAKDQYGCPTSTATVDVVLNVAPQVIAQDLISVCDGSLLDVQASSDKQLNWYYADAKNPTVWGDAFVENSNVAVKHDINVKNAGSYILIKGEYPGLKGVCSTIKQISLNVIDKPKVEFSSNGAVCPGEPFSLSTKSEGGVADADYYVKNWFTVDKNPAFGTDDEPEYINFNPTATTNQMLSSGDRYYALIASSNELTTCRDTFYMKYTAVGVPQFTDPTGDDFQKKFCLGNEGIVLKVDNASDINFNEVRWYAGVNAGGEMIKENGTPVYGDHIIVAPRATSNYYVEGTGENGCKVSGLFTVKVNEAPNYVLSSSALNGKVCKGADLVVNAVNLNSAIPATTFTWNNVEGTSSKLEIPAVTGVTDVKLTVETADGCTQDLKASYGIIESPTFKVQAPKNVCANGDVIVTANVDGAADPADYVYSWSLDENMATGIKNGQTYTFDNVSVNDGANGFNFYATVKDRVYGCTSEEIIKTSVNVVNPSDPVVSYVDKVCEGESVNIELTGTKASADLTGYTFFVKTPEWTDFQSQTSTVFTTGPINAPRLYSYYVQLTQGEAVCKSNPSSVVVSVESKPNILVQEFGSPCSEQELTLKASAYGVESDGIIWEANKVPGDELSFTIEQGILKVTENSQNVTAVKKYIQKQVSGGTSTDVEKTCSQTLNYKYKSYPLPRINVIEDKSISSHCPGNNIYFDAEALTENLKSITWSGTGVFATIKSGDTITSQHVYVTVPKDENIDRKNRQTQLYYTVSNDRCTNSGSINVTYDTTPGFTLKQIEPIESDYGHNKKGPFGSVIKFCENSKVILQANSDFTDGSVFTWRGGTEGTKGQEYNQSGTYEVSVVNDKGCKSSMLFNLDMELLPSLSADVKGVNANSHYCYKEGNDNGLIIDVATSDEAYCFVKMDDNDNKVPAIGDPGWKIKSNRLESNPEQDTWVRAYSMSNSDLHCVNDSSIWIEVNKSPIVGIAGDKVACNGNPINLEVVYNSPDNAEPIKYSWIGEGLKGQNGPTISAENLGSGKKTIQVVVTDENLCQGDATVDVKVLSKPTIGLSVDGGAVNRRLRELKFCDGESKEVVPSCVDCDEEYQMREFGWVYNEEDVVDANGNSTQNVTVSKRGNYTVYGMLYDANDQPLCESSAGFIATPIDKPMINVSGNTTICANSMIELNGANITNYTYTWSGNTIQGYVGNNFVCEPSKTGVTTVSLMVKDESTTCTNTTTFEVNTISAPSPNVTAPEVICENSSDEFVIKDYLNENNEPKYTNIKWTVWNDEQTEALKQTSEGTPKFNLQMTDKPLKVVLDLKSSDMQYPCASTVVFPVKAQKHQALQYSGDPVACQNSNVTLEVTKEGTAFRPDANTSNDNNPYSWTLPDGSVVVTPTNQYVFKPEASGNYMVDVENAVCVDRLQFRLEVKSAPIAYPSYDKSVCIDGTTVLNVTPINESGTMTYVWNNVDANGPVTTKTPTYLVKPEGPKTNYSVEITSDATKCKSVYDMSVIVRESPNILIDKTQGELEPCIGQNGVAVADGAVSYRWYDVTDSSAEKLIGFGPSNSRSINMDSKPVTIKVIGYDSIGCASDPIYETLTPTPLPDFNISGSKASVCAGELVILSAESNVDNTVYQYSWYDPIKDRTVKTQELQVYPEKTTQFEVTATTVTKHKSECSSQKSFVQKVDQRPELTIYGDQTVCDGVEYTFRAVGAKTYEWQHNDKNTGDSFTTSFKADFGDTASVVVVGSNGLCSSTPTRFRVDVRKAPTLTFKGDSVVCGNNQATITAMSSVPNVTYYWPTESITAQSIRPVVQPAYQVFPCTVRDVYGCATTDSFKVNVVAAPKLLLNASYFDSPLKGGNIAYDSASSKFRVPFCDGDSLSLRLTGATSFEWVTTFGNDTLSTADVYKVRPDGPMTFTATGHLSGCKASADFVLDMNQKPTLFLLSDTILCRGAAQEMVASASGYGKLLYNWTMKEHNNRGFIENADTLHNVIAERPIEDSLNNIYTVSVRIAETQCTTTKEFHFGYVKSPEFQIDGDRAACVGSSLDLRAVPENPDDKYTYSWDDEDGMWHKSGEQATYVFRTPGKQPKIKVSAYDGGCRVYQDLELTGWEAPQLQAYALGDNVDKQVVVCENTPFNISVMDTATAMSKTWWVKEGDTVSTTSSIHVTASVAETYTAHVMNTYGCVSELAVPVVVEYAPLATNRMGGDSVEICKLETAKFDLQAVNIDTLHPYTWDDPARTDSSVLEVSPEVTTRYLVNVRGINGCERGQYFTVLVNDIPQVQFNTIGGVKGDPEAACFGSDYKLVVSPRTTGDYSYIWDTKSGSDTLHLRANTMDPEKHVVRITDKVTGCANKDSFTVRTQALPVITIGAEDKTSVCRGDKLVLNAGGAAEYFWMRGTDTLKKSATLQVDEVTSPGIYTAYGDDRGCVGKLEVPVTVRETPNVYLNSASSGVVEGNTVSLCDGTEKLELEVASSFAGGVDPSDLKYTWMNLNSTDKAVDQVLTIPSVTQNKDYMVKVSRISAPEACPGNIMVSVRVLNTPRIHIKGDRNVCDNDYAQLIPYGDKDDSFDNYVWKDHKGNSYGMEDTLKVLVTDTVTYTVTGY
ncbi:MAG: hypothetical protein KBT22_10325, partial [Bacteroidales bacterium]|nr:hypothetical protein [Candidatus Scybalocola fimicaballi]